MRSPGESAQITESQGPLMGIGKGVGKLSKRVEWSGRWRIAWLAFGSRIIAT